MEKIFKKEPEWFSEASKHSLIKWKEQGPLSISEIVSKSKMKIKDLDSDDIEIKKVDCDNEYHNGMFKKGTEEEHGIVRKISYDG